jgi:hypothetical protein
MPFVINKELSEQKILQLKNIFDVEIKNKRFQVVKRLSKECLYNHFMLYRNFEMVTDWYNQCQEIESINNYFESIIDYGFSSINDLSIEKIQMCIPYRTCQPISDGESYYRVVYGDEYKNNSPLQNAVFLLSSGKICFCEIVSILQRNEKFKQHDKLEDDIYAVFQEFDKEYLVVWKCAF